MEQYILKEAASVGTPLGLAGLTVGILYLVYRLILKGKLSKVVPKDTFKLLNRIAMYMFILALVAIVLGVGAFVLAKTVGPSGPKFSETLHLEQEAFYHLQQGYYSTALTEANELIKADPKNSTAYSLAGSAHFKLGEYPSALQSFQTALDAEPNSLTIRFDKGAALIALGDYRNAQSILEELRDADPSDVTVRYNLALANLLDGNYVAAKEGYAFVVKQPSKLDASATLGLGISEMLGVTQGASGFGPDSASQGLAHLREAIRLEPRLRELFAGTIVADGEQNYEPYISVLKRLEQVDVYKASLDDLRNGK